MRAVIKFKDRYGNRRQKTINATVDEPNAIIREFVKQTYGTDKFTYISTVKCGRREYQWFDEAKSAGVR